MHPAFQPETTARLRREGKRERAIKSRRGIGIVIGCKDARDAGAGGVFWREMSLAWFSSALIARKASEGYEICLRSSRTATWFAGLRAVCGMLAQ
eukprot:386318-Prymnesium_polylepis.1